MLALAPFMLCLLLLVILGVAAMRFLVRLGWNGRAFILPTVVLGGTLLAGLGMLLGRPTSESDPEAAVTASYQNDAALPSVPIPKLASVSGSELPEDFEPVQQQKVIVITTDSFEKRLTPETAETLRRLYESLPSELLDSYALIPLSRPGDVRSHDVVPVVVAQHFNASGAIALKTAVVRLVQAIAAQSASGKEVASSDPAGVETQEGEVAVTPANESGSVSRFTPLVPHLGQVRVSSIFEEPSVSTVDALRPAIEIALRDEAKKWLKSEGLWSDGDAMRLVDFKLSDALIEESIQQTRVQYQEIDSAVEGDIPLQKTHATVQFPNWVRQKTTREVRTALQESRTKILGIAIGGAWSAVLLLGLTIRVTRGSSVLKKVFVLPVMGLAIFPAIGLFVEMSFGMAHDKTVKIPFDGRRIVCELDVPSEDRP